MWGRNTWRVTIYNVTFELWDCREWHAPYESPRDMSTITNRLSMMWPRMFSRKDACLSFARFATFHRGGVSENLVILAHLAFDVIIV